MKQKKFKKVVIYNRVVYQLQPTTWKPIGSDVKTNLLVVTHIIRTKRKNVVKDNMFALPNL